MSTLVTILHVVVCLFLMLTVLLQQGKGGMGGAFGGSNAGSVFGGSGASGFLRKLTAAAAGIFMLTSMTLAFLATADAGDALADISKREAARKRREKESQRKLLEAANAAAGDAGVTNVDTSGDAGTTPLTPPPGDTIMEPVVPGEIVPTPGAEQPTTPPAETPPATPPAQPGVTAPGTTLTPPAPSTPTPRPPAATPPAPAPGSSAAPVTP